MIETTRSLPLADPPAESVRRLRASLQAERIYLFGSRARDEAHEDSDYDSSSLWSAIHRCRATSASSRPSAPCAA